MCPSDLIPGMKSNKHFLPCTQTNTDENRRKKRKNECTQAATSSRMQQRSEGIFCSEQSCGSTETRERGVGATTLRLDARKPGGSYYTGRVSENNSSNSSSKRFSDTETGRLPFLIIVE